MAQMTAKDLRLALVGVHDDTPIVFQGNVSSGEEGKGEEPEYTTTLGYVYSAFHRDGILSYGEFVIDGAITNQE